MFYAIRHITRYRYDAPIRESVMQVYMQPKSDGAQRLQSFQVTTQPRATLQAYTDHFGNAVYHFDVPGVHHDLQIEAEAAVEVQALPAPPEWVDASAWQALGAGDIRILIRHILPSVVAPVVIAATLGVAGAIMAESSLSFLGLGVQPPTPSWGAMIADGRDLYQLRHAPWTSVFPGLAIGAAVLGFNLLGDALRDALDPRAVRAAIPRGAGLPDIARP